MRDFEDQQRSRSKHERHLASQRRRLRFAAVVVDDGGNTSSRDHGDSDVGATVSGVGPRPCVHCWGHGGGGGEGADGWKPGGGGCLRPVTFLH